MSDAVVAVVFRGNVVECEHRADVAVVERQADGSARLVAWHGDPHRVVPLRSAAKPFQAMASYAAGLATLGIELGSPELAIMCASHGATDEQRAAVRAVLARAGLPETALQNGTHPPLSPEGQRAVEQEGRGLTAIFGNCSGKHAGMLAACVTAGWDPGSYLDPQHPLQQAVLARLAQEAGLAESAIEQALDGCGAPTFALPLTAAAAAYAGLRDERRDDPLAWGVSEAMLRHPSLIGAPASLPVALMGHTGRVLAKNGADGVFCMALPDRHLGAAFKVRDGAERVMPALVMAVLAQLDAVTPAEQEALARYARPPVLNLHGERVGHIEASLQLRRA